MPHADKEEYNAYCRAYRLSRRAEWLAANGPCKVCGSWENLEVDHIDPTTKESNVAFTWCRVRREEELSKCQVLCEECHKKKSAAWVTATKRVPEHGTAHCYNQYACRCTPCRKANNVRRVRLKLQKQ